MFNAGKYICRIQIKMYFVSLELKDSVARVNLTCRSKLKQSPLKMPSLEGSYSSTKSYKEARASMKSSLELSQLGDSQIAKQWSKNACFINCGASSHGDLILESQQYTRFFLKNISTTAFCVEAAQAVEVKDNWQMALTRVLWMTLPPTCFLNLSFRVQGLPSVAACLYTTFFSYLPHSAVHGAVAGSSDHRLSWGLWEPLGIWNVWMIFIMTLCFSHSHFLRIACWNM